jgi:hypothetical protein
MVWRIKAACLAYELGYDIGAPAFQNYAMGRLFRAYQVDTPKVEVSPAMYRWSKSKVPMVHIFLEDVILRNWGDKDVVNHELEEWSAEIKENDIFRNRFVKAVGIPIQARQQEAMVLERYLVEEED